MKNFKFSTKTLVFLALFVAIEVVLSRFLSINAWNIRIGFSFVPLALCAMIYGPLPAGIVAAIADVIGALLFPTGAFFPGFTATAFLTGLTFGLCFYKKQTPVRILIAVIINQGVLGLLINTLWISILYGSPYLPLMATRAIQAGILFAVQFVVIMAMVPIKNRVGRNIIQNEA